MLLIAYGFVALAVSTRTRMRALLIVLLALLLPLHRLALGIFSEPLFLMLTSAGVYSLMCYSKGSSSKPLYIAGLLLGASALVRPVNLLAVAFLVSVLLWKRKIAIRQAVLTTIVSALVVTPWTVRNWIVFDKLVPIAAHHGSIYYMTDAEVFWPALLYSAGYTHSLPVHRKIVGDDLELDLKANERYWQRARDNIKADPMGFFGRCVMKTIFIWTYLPGTKGLIFDKPWLFALGALVQLLFLYTSARWIWERLRADAPVAWIVFGYAVYSILILFPFYAESRMLLPVYIWLFGGAANWVLERVSSMIIPRSLVSA